MRILEVKIMTDTIKIIFCGNNTPVDVFLKIFTCFKYSHVGIITPEGTVIHATTPVVKEDSLADFKKRYPKWEIVEFKVPKNSKKGYKWLHDQLGKDYDFSAIFGIICQHNWNNPYHWFCSELATAFLIECGWNKINTKYAGTIWPQMLYVLR
jgi:uncharacterized protein YycO